MYVHRTARGVEIVVAVVPNAKRTEAVGLHGDALRVRLHAPAVEGRANAELLRWLAQELDVPASSLAIVRGELSRRKTVRCTAQDENVVVTKARALAVVKPGPAPRGPTGGSGGPRTRS